MIFENYYGHGVMTCPTCWGKGHRIGSATTTAAECWTCLGVGRIGYSPLETTARVPVEKERKA